MSTYKIYCIDNLRSIDDERDPLSIMNGMMDGAYYYAGSVEADDLEGAWMATQNDNCPNEVVFSATCQTTLQELLRDNSDYQEVVERIKRQGGIIKPAVWNGEFAQRSTMVGDVFEVDGELYRVAPCGFERMAYGKTAGILVKNMKANPWAPKREINEDFDSLITD